MSLRLWAVQADLTQLPEVTFDNATDFGLTAQDLVADDYTATQQLAEALRAQGARGLVAPSAALPGTRIAALFGPRLATGWLDPPLDELLVPTAHALDGPPTSEAVPRVRWFGDTHPSLEQWQTTGRFDYFEEPPVPR